MSFCNFDSLEGLFFEIIAVHPLYPIPPRGICQEVDAIVFFQHQVYHLLCMRKFLIPTAIVIMVLAAFAGFYLLTRSTPGSKTPTPLPSDYEYFWGNGCPHCANVSAFLDTWSEKDKIKIDKKEVWNNPTNAALMQERFSYCKVIDKTQMGVPLLFTPDGKCLVGDTPVIDYFKNLKL